MNILAVVLLVGMFSLSGCTTKSPTEAAVEAGINLQPSQTEVNACLQWVQAKEDKRMAKLDTMDSQDKAYVMIHHDTMDMVKDVFGKKKNECQPGTNVWDAYIAWVEAENKTKQEIAREAGSTTRFLGGVAGAATTVIKMADKAGDKVFGDKTGRDKNSAGEGVELNGTNTDVSTRINQNTVAASDGGDVTPGAQTVNNPGPATEPQAAAVPATVPATVPAVTP